MKSHPIIGQREGTITMQAYRLSEQWNYHVTDQHYYQRHQKHKQRNAVHSVHIFDITVSGCIGIPFFNKEVFLYLSPDAHKLNSKTNI